MFEYSNTNIKKAINNGVNNYIITNTNTLNGLDVTSNSYQVRMNNLRMLIASLGKQGYNIPDLEQAIIHYLDNNIIDLPEDRALSVDKLTNIMPTLLNRHIWLHNKFLDGVIVEETEDSFVDEILTKELEEDPFVFATAYTKDKVNLVPIMVAGDFTLIYNDDNRDFYIARDYDVDSREWTSLDCVGNDVEGLNNGLDAMETRAELTNSNFVTFTTTFDNEEMDAKFKNFEEVHESNLLFYRVPASGFCSGEVYVKAENKDTAIDIADQAFALDRAELIPHDWKIDNDMVETCTIEDIPDGDILFDEDGSPMEVQDAKALVTNKNRGSKQSISSNIKQSINSGKVEKVQNKEQEYSEKRLHEREISRDERFGDTDYNVDSPY